MMAGPYDWPAKPLYIQHGYMLSDAMSGAPKEHARGSLAEYVTAGRDRTMAFTLTGGTEMKA